MTFDAASQVGTAAVRPQHAFDEGALLAWMQANVAGFAGPLTVEQFKGGQSNPTFRLRTPGGDYVMRRKPAGPLLRGAHAIDREARVLAALDKAGIPVPKVHGLCEDDSVIGTAFFIMDMVEGPIFWDATLPEIAPEQRPGYFDAMNDAIARLHSVDYQAVGLADFGRQSGFYARQIATWSKQYLADGEAGRDPHMDRLLAWLPENIPTDDETTIIHGDFRIDNMIFAQDASQVAAILDWELSTLGNPVADFAYHAMMYRMPPLVVPGLVGSDLVSLNIPDEAQYVAAYCRRTGRDGLPGLDYAMAFNFFRFAAILHGIKGRVLRGNAANEQAQERANAFPAIAEMAWEQARQAGAR